MTERKWLSSTNPSGLLRSLWRQAEDRKTRLFSCACCRDMWDLLSDARSRRAIELTEALVDGDVDLKEHERAYLDAYNASEGFERLCVALTAGPGSEAKWMAAERAHAAVSSWAYVWWIAGITINAAALLRDIFGNPFRPVSFDPEWRTSNVVALAQSMYESRDFSPMPILGDALQDAGCENEDILAHCRGDGPHVRGCWVVDLILGKE